MSNCGFRDTLLNSLPVPACHSGSILRLVFPRDCKTLQAVVCLSHDREFRSCLLNGTGRSKEGKNTMPWKNINGYAFTAGSILTNAPSQSGVYGIYNSRKWIYIGESGDIRARLLQHLKGDNKCISQWNPTHFSYELWPEHQRVARQKTVMVELKPACSQRLNG